MTRHGAKLSKIKTTQTRRGLYTGLEIRYESQRVPQGMLRNEHVELECQSASLVLSPVLDGTSPKQPANHHPTSSRLGMNHEKEVCFKYTNFNQKQFSPGQVSSGDTSFSRLAHTRPLLQNTQ